MGGIETPRKRSCQTKKALIKGNKLPLNGHLHLLYYLFTKLSYAQIKLYTGYSKNTITSAKAILRKKFALLNTSRMIIGGLGLKVEVDETVLCRWGVIRNPSSADDEEKDTVWIIGIIDSVNKENFL